MSEKVIACLDFFVLFFFGECGDGTSLGLGASFGFVVCVCDTQVSIDASRCEQVRHLLFLRIALSPLGLEL